MNSSKNTLTYAATKMPIDTLSQYRHHKTALPLQPYDLNTKELAAALRAAIKNARILADAMQQTDRLNQIQADVITIIQEYASRLSPTEIKNIVHSLYEDAPSPSDPQPLMQCLTIHFDPSQPPVALSLRQLYRINLDKH